MKDSRFIELLNLYVDREITPTEAAELETEVHRSAPRRQVFNQYARMDRACTLVLSQVSAVPAPKLAAALADAERKVVDYPEHAVGRSKLVFLGGLMAAAAAVAVVFFNRGTIPLPEVKPMVSQPAPRMADVPPVPATSTGRETTVALPFGGNRPAPDVAAERPAYAWMKSMELSRPAPLSDADLILVARNEKPFSSGLTRGLHLENTPFQKGGATRPPTELNAFEARK